MSKSACTTGSPKKIVHIDVYRAPEGHHFGIFNRASVIPDNRYLMRVNFDHGLNTDDDVTIELTENGYLSSVNSTVTDQSGEIVLRLVEIAKSALMLGPTFAGPNFNNQAASLMNKGYGTSTVAKPVFITTYALDPTAPHECSRLKSRYGIELQLERLSDCRVAPRAARTCGTECVRSRRGVCYRPTMAYQLVLMPGGHDLKGLGATEALGDDRSSRSLVLLPNEAPIFCIPVEGTAFGKGVTELSFNEGMLTKVHAVRPSELLGFLSIPAGVLERVLALPGELFTIRIENNTKVGTVVDSELTRLEALERFATRLAELQQAAQERDDEAYQELLERLGGAYQKAKSGAGARAAHAGGGPGLTATGDPGGPPPLPDTYPGHLEFDTATPDPDPPAGR